MCSVAAFCGLALAVIVLIGASRSFHDLITLRVISTGDCELARSIEIGWVRYVTDEKDIIKNVILGVTICQHAMNENVVVTSFCKQSNQSKHW
ncbi:hypothetical protein BZG83_05015 [Salinivibrio sp. PR919]|nr:hypothetical protein BZG83_05015 [Salinivibrio sp. PR919]OOF17581.1 hypothetical protein BZG84_06270 [Salinivibrio sp. PR932]